MSQQNPVIQPPSLRLKVGGRFGAIDPSAIAKAEAALKSLSGNFAQWLSEEVVKLDVAYIDNWSLWGDVKILFKTIYVVFAGKGAK